MLGIDSRIDEVAKKILELSRNDLLLSLRFMNKAINILKWQPVVGLEGVAVDGVHIFYDPVFVLKSFSEEKKSVSRQYLHMLLHCVYQHFWGSGHMNQDYWNLACDIAVEYTINELELAAVTTENIKLEDEKIQELSCEVKYMTADMLYKYFLTGAVSAEKLDCLEKIFSLDLHQIWYGSRKNMGGEGSAFQQLNFKKKEWKEISYQAKIYLETFSKERGTKAKGMVQNLREVTREKYDYAEFLKKFAVLGEKMKINDEEFDYIFYTYGMRVYGNMPLIEPLEYKEVRQVKELVIVIDTSGSTSGAVVQNFVRKTYNILKEGESFFTRFNIHIVQCDMKIQEAVKITNQLELDHYLGHMQIHGLGGTDFRPAFSYVDEMIANKEFTNLKGMIYFTDGFGIFPARQPDYKVAVVYVEEGYNNPKVPVWAIKLMLHPEDIEGDAHEY